MPHRTLGRCTKAAFLLRPLKLKGSRPSTKEPPKDAAGSQPDRLPLLKCLPHWGARQEPRPHHRL